MYTREQAVARIKRIADEMLRDHEEHTGVTSRELHSLRFWLNELQSLEDNS